MCNQHIVIISHCNKLAIFKVTTSFSNNSYAAETGCSQFSRQAPVGPDWPMKNMQVSEVTDEILRHLPSWCQRISVPAERLWTHLKVQPNSNTIVRGATNKWVPAELMQWRQTQPEYMHNH